MWGPDLDELPAHARLVVRRHEGGLFVLATVPRRLLAQNLAAVLTDWRSGDGEGTPDVVRLEHLLRPTKPERQWEQPVFDSRYSAVYLSVALGAFRQERLWPRHPVDQQYEPPWRSGGRPCHEGDAVVVHQWPEGPVEVLVERVEPVLAKAMPYCNGEHRTLATFTAHGRKKPARPRAVKVSRNSIRWSGSAKRYGIHVSVSDGRELFFLSRGRTLRVPGIDRRSVSVRVVGLRADNTHGPAGTARSTKR